MSATIIPHPRCNLMEMAGRAHELGMFLVGRDGRIVMDKPGPGEPVLVLGSLLVSKPAPIHPQRFARLQRTLQHIKKKWQR